MFISFISFIFGTLSIAGGGSNRLSALAELLLAATADNNAAGIRPGGSGVTVVRSPPDPDGPLSEAIADNDDDDDVDDLPLSLAFRFVPV